MPRAKRAEIEEQDITGLKYFRQLGSLLQKLHDVGCEGDRAGNRSLHMDQYCTMPLVDGTVITALPRIAQASFLETQSGHSNLMNWTLHTHFEVDRHVPTRIDVTPTGGGEFDERAVMDRAVESDRTYVMDRGYAKFELFNRIVDAGSSYVCRIRDNSVYDVLSEQELTDAARAAHVMSDEIIQLGSAQAKSKPKHRLRLILIEMEPHQKRTRYGGKSTGPNCDGVLRIATNLLDVPAEIIALMYRYRWTIEIFFRFFKHMLCCRHLLSRSQNGIEIQTYCATKKNCCRTFPDCKNRTTETRAEQDWVRTQ